MAKTKKSTKRTRHPNITKAIAEITKLQKGHKQMALQLERTKTGLVHVQFGSG